MMGENESFDPPVIKDSCVVQQNLGVNLQKQELCCQQYIKAAINVPREIHKMEATRQRLEREQETQRRQVSVADMLAVL